MAPAVSVSGPVWASLMQTSQAAEHIGAAAPSIVQETTFQIASDCVAVVNCCRKPNDQQLLAKHALYVFQGLNLCNLVLLAACELYGSSMGLMRAL